MTYSDYQNSKAITDNELSTTESFTVSEDHQKLFESLDYETCCPEEELYVMDAQLRDSLTDKHGDISDINEFFTLLDKSRNRIALTPEESLEWHRLLALFFPSQNNIEAYESAQWFFELPRIKGTYSMAYDD